MKFDAAQITKLARETGFPADNLEKVLRLRELLTELHQHPFLSGKLVLKGGTALNLFYLDLARLSVDIDLNYIAHIDREATLRERPEITRAVEQVATGLGYKLQNGVDEYALCEWYLSYQNHTGKPDRIQIEINFLMRACALAPKVLAAAALAGAPPCQFLLLETEELFGGKIKAMQDTTGRNCSSRAKPPSSNASSGTRHFSGKPIMSHGICHARRRIPNTSTRRDSPTTAQRRQRRANEKPLTAMRSSKSQTAFSSPYLAAFFTIPSLIHLPSGGSAEPAGISISTPGAHSW